MCNNSYNFNKNLLIQLFLDLVKIEGLSGNEKNVASYIKDFLTKLGFEYFEEDDAHLIDGGNQGNLICPVYGGGDFVLVSHMDTARTTKGINPVIEDGKIKTDGKTILGADNRAGITAILYALQHALNEGKKIKPHTIVFTICEETSLSGSKNLKLNNQNIRKGFVFDSHLEPGYFIVASPGALFFNFIVKGKPAHSGIEPEKGINAIQAAANAISKIKQGRLDDSTTLNIGKIKGGEAVNVIPAYVEIEGEIRSFELEKIQKYFNELTSIFKDETSASGCEFIMNSSWDFKPYKISSESEVYRSIKEAIEKSNLLPKESISFGGSDANSFNARGIECVNIGIGAKNPHSNDEYILIEHLMQASIIAYHLIVEE